MKANTLVRILAIAGLLAVGTAGAADNFNISDNTAITISGGTIDNTVIGGTTPAAARVTTLRVGNANDIYLTRYAAKQLMISGDGVGATTNAGWIAGYSGSSGYGALWNTTLTPSATNYAFSANDTVSTVNAVTQSAIAVSNIFKLTLTSSLNTSINPLSITDATDSSSTTTGSLKTAGGLGVAKKSFFGSDVSVTGTLSATGAISSSVAGGRAIKADNVTDATQTQMEVSNTNGRYEAGVLTNGWSYAGSITAGANFQLYANNTAIATVSSTGLAVTGTLSATGITSITDTTNSSSTTTGSLKTAGGLGVAKKAYFGDAITQGSGATGLVIMPYTGGGYGAIYNANVTPAAANFALIANANNTYINATTNSGFQVNNLTKVSYTAALSTHSGNQAFDKTITAPGTTAVQEINKTTGRINIAIGETSKAVTNSLVDANSICIAVAATNDTTGYVKNVVAGSGTFTINVVAPTAEMAVNFRCTN